MNLKQKLILRSGFVDYHQNDIPTFASMLSSEIEAQLKLKATVSGAGFVLWEHHPQHWLLIAYYHPLAFPSNSGWAIRGLPKAEYDLAEAKLFLRHIVGDIPDDAWIGN